MGEGLGGAGEESGGQIRSNKNIFKLVLLMSSYAFYFNVGEHYFYCLVLSP